MKLERTLAKALFEAHAVLHMHQYLQAWQSFSKLEHVTPAAISSLNA